MSPDPAMAPEGLPPVLRADDIARVFSISPRVARRWLANGTLPSRKLGKSRYVLREVLLAYLAGGSSGVLNRRGEG